MKHWPWITVIATFAAIGVGLMAVQPHDEDHSGDKDDFSADLAFFFDCKGKAEPPSDQAIESFLAERGFRVLNKVRLAKEQHADYSWKTMDIIGIDDARRKIEFDASPEDPDTYSVGLWSEPPTHHSTDLERALLDFTENTLGCSNRQIERFENPAAAKDIYDFSFKRTQGWYEQAAKMQGSGRE